MYSSTSDAAATAANDTALTFRIASLPLGADEHMTPDELRDLAELNRTNPDGSIEAELGRFPAFMNWPEWVSDWYWAPTGEVACSSVAHPSPVASVAREIPEAAPCALCGTTQGSKRSDGNGYLRYRGEPYGVQGVLCVTCRGRERKKAMKAEGKRPARKRPSRQPSDNNIILPTSWHMAETIRAIRLEHEEDGIKPREGLTEVEQQQETWAALAIEARREAVASRHSRYRWSPMVPEPTAASRRTSPRA